MNPSMAEYLEFREFLRWRDSQRVSTPLTSTAPIYIPRSVAPAPLKIDYEKVMRRFWAKMGARNGNSKHYGLFMMFKGMYNEQPERFVLTGELHSDLEGKTYFSGRYMYPYYDNNYYMSFHYYCHIEGNHVIFDKVTAANAGQVYELWLNVEGDTSSNDS
jgi:hypothetical protein